MAKKQKRSRDPIKRMTLSVPGSLKKEIEDFQSRHWVNWSAVFAEAVRQHIKQTK